MSNNSKSLLVIMGLTIWMVVGFCYINNANADSNTNLFLNITPGTLSQNVESDVSGSQEILMSTTDVFLAPPAGTSATGLLTTQIKDHRGTSVGWSQTATCSDFVSGGNTILVTNFTITPNTLTGLGATPTTGVNLGPAHTFASIIDPALIAKADPGYGTGRFEIVSLLDLHIDKTTPVGIYTAIMTVTIS